MISTETLFEDFFPSIVRYPRRHGNLGRYTVCLCECEAASCRCCRQMIIVHKKSTLSLRTRSMMLSTCRRCSHQKLSHKSLRAFAQQSTQPTLLLLLFSLASFPVTTHTTSQYGYSSQFTHTLNELYAALQPQAACPPPNLLRPAFFGSACVLPAPPFHTPHQHEQLCEFGGRTLVIGDRLSPSLIHSPT